MLQAQPQRKKILYLVTLAERGGAQRYVFDLATHLGGEFSIVVASGQPGPLLDDLTATGIPTAVVPQLNREINPLQDLRAIRTVRQLLQLERPDLVHLNSSKAGVIGSYAARQASVPAVVYTAHGFVFNEPLGRLRRSLYANLERWSARRVDRIICVAEADRQSALLQRIAPPAKLLTIHNGIDVGSLGFYPKEYARQILSDHYKLKAISYKLVGTIANCYPTKGILDLIAAAAQVIRQRPEVQFLVIGDGPQRPQLAASVAQQGLANSFHLVGELPQAARLLKALDVYCLSSRKEGLPYSLLEAMAAGLPIAATAVGGVPEAIRNGQEGLLIEPGKPERLAAAISSLLDTPAQAATLGQAAARRMAESFSLEAMIERTAACYRQLLR